MWDLKQFIITRDKKPIGGVDPLDPANWMTYEAAKMSGAEIGFVFTEHDPYFFVDIDACLDDCGQWSDLSKSVCAMFPGAYIEVSRSGRGLHIIASSTVFPEHACKNVPLGLELYHKERLVVLTGYGGGDPGSYHEGALHQLTALYFPKL